MPLLLQRCRSIATPIHMGRPAGWCRRHSPKVFRRGTAGFITIGGEAWLAGSSFVHFEYAEETEIIKNDTPRTLYVDGRADKRFKIGRRARAVWIATKPSFIFG